MTGRVFHTQKTWIHDYLIYAMSISMRLKQIGNKYNLFCIYIDICAELSIGILVAFTDSFITVQEDIIYINYWGGNTKLELLRESLDIFSFSPCSYISQNSKVYWPALATPVHDFQTKQHPQVSNTHIKLSNVCPVCVFTCQDITYQRCIFFKREKQNFL